MTDNSHGNSQHSLGTSERKTYLIKNCCSGKIQCRNTHQEEFLGRGVLKLCNRFTGEHRCRSAISMKLQSNCIEITLWYGCSPVNFLHNFRTSFLMNSSGRLLLSMKLILTSISDVDEYHLWKTLKSCTLSKGFKFLLSQKQKII